MIFAKKEKLVMVSIMVLPDFEERAFDERFFKKEKVFNIVNFNSAMLSRDGKFKPI